MSQPTPDLPDRAPRAFPRAVPPLVSALVGMALYAVTLGGTWVYDDVYHLFVDDRTQVTQYDRAQGRDRPAIEDPRQWGRYLTESYNGGVDNLYRPVTSLSYALQATLHGRAERVAWAWHALNVLLYGVVCAQVALLSGRLMRAGEAPTLGSTQDEPADNGNERNSRDRAWWVALCAGLLFAAHPVHVEAVAAIVGRAELICAVGFLGGLLVVMCPLTPARIAAFIALMFLSIGGKEQGLILPAVVAAWYLSRRHAGLPSLTRTRTALQNPSPQEADDVAGTTLSYQPASQRAREGLGKIFFIAVALPLAGYLVAREVLLDLSMAWPRHFLDPTIQPMVEAAGADRWLMPIAIAGRYLHLLLWPHRLSIDYGTAVIAPPQRLDDPYLWLGVLAMLFFLAALVHALRARWAAGLTALAGFALTYGLVSNIGTIIGTVFGERLMFLPSAFFVIYGVMLGARLLRAPAALRAGFALVFVMVLLGSVRTVSYAARWTDTLAFYDYQSRVQPRSVRIRMLLADELRRQGQLESAADAAARATEIEPDYWDSWVLRANIAAERGRLEEALEYADRAVAARTSVKTTGVRAQIERMLHERHVPATQPE